MEYRIKKLINNNVVFSEDENGNEIIVFGKALGFARKPGDPIDSSRIVKVFSLQSKQDRNFLQNLVENIDPLYIDIATEIIHLYEEKMNVKVNDMMYLGLSDHISNSVNNAKESFFVSLDIIDQIKETYPKAFMIGLQALNIIHERTGVELPEDEAGYITLHYISSQGETYSSNGRKKALFQSNVVKKIEDSFEIRIDKTTFYYSRFLTHLSFLSARLSDHRQEDLGNDFVFDAVNDRYPGIENCVNEISRLTKETYKTEMTREEKGYLALHILNLLKSSNKGMGNQ